MIALGIAIAYALVGVLAFRRMGARWIGEFGRLDTGDVVILAAYATVWPVAWPVISAMIPSRPERTHERLERWMLG